MDPYDSDSSLSDAESGQSTNVLLGYASEESTEDAISQLGGLPTWLAPEQHPPPNLVQCKCCNDYLTLLLQLNGDLPDKFPGHERRLYIWACRRKTCRRKPGSVRATRGVRISNTHTEAQEKTTRSTNTTQEAKTRKDLGSSLFGAQSGANPFSSSSTSNPFSQSSSSNPFSTASANPFSTAPAPVSSLAAKSPQTPTKPIGDLSATFAAKARISSSAPVVPQPSTPTAPWPQASQLPKPYPTYHLDADYEYLTAPPSSKKNAQYSAMDDIEPNSAGGSSGGGKEDADPYESAHDKAFQHFADILAQNPEQVLRYEFAGSPLLYSRADEVGRLFAAASHVSSDLNAKVSTSAAGGGQGSSGMPRCVHCGAHRVFEVQLTPHAIAELEAEEEAATLLKDGMEWGSIIIGVCSKDCGAAGEGRVGYVEEWAGVQWEEVVKYDQKR